MSIARELDEARRDVDRMKAVLRTQEHEVREAQQSEREMMSERDSLAMTCEDLRKANAALRAELAEAWGRCDEMRAAIDALVNDAYPARNDDGDYLVPGRLVDNAAALVYTSPAERDARGTTGESE